MKFLKRILPLYLLYAAALTLILLSYVVKLPSVVVISLAYVAGVVLVTVICAIPLTGKWEEWIRIQILQWMRKCWDNKKKAGKFALILLADALLAVAAERIIAHIFYNGDSFYWGRYIASFVILELISLYVFYKEIVAKKVEIAVMVVILSIGSIFAATMPASCGVSWDDEAHYNFSMLLSHFFDMTITEADAYILENFPTTALEHERYDRESRQEWDQEMDALYKDGKTDVTIRMWPRYKKLCYIPPACGLLLGRAMHLPYHIVFMMGRWFNLLFYAVMVFLSLKKLKTGKMIGTVVALMPFLLFAASSYSHDAWLTAWVMYGFCCFFGELQSPEKKMNFWDWIRMPLAFFIGVGPKIIYVPLILILLFLPKEKYENPKHKKWMVGIVAAVTLVLIADFMLPFIMANGGSVEDTRGGTGVDAAAQTAYILTNPLAYAGTLLKFLSEYVSLTSTERYIADLSYFSNLQSAGFGALLAVTLWVTVFTDRDSRDCNVGVIPRLAVLLLSFGITCLIATAMYIAFTGVEADTILGCQFRYLGPLIFPVTYVIGSGKIENRMRREYYNGIILAVCSFVLIYAVWKLAINLY